MKLPAVLALAIVLAAPGLAPAQAPLQNALFTAGTAAKDNQNDDWAFLLFQLTADIETLFTRRLAVYQKPGALDAPGAFTHSGNVALQDNPTVIKGLLNRAAALGQAPGDLNFAIDELFGELVPSPDLAVEQKLSAVIRGSVGDPRQFANLMLLARMNPGVSLALGLAHAQRINAGTTTFEIRELNPAGAEIGVVGRVAVVAGQPVLLTAPHAPVAVPETSALGHLNARLRWGVPDDLRRLSLLQYGFNLYRVNKDYAESLGWEVNPPAHGVLAAAATAIPEVRHVNRAPVLPTAIFNEIQALDLNADPKTFFIADDNGLAGDNPVPFKDGARYYYFVAARDILGRDGHTSPGTEVMLFDRVPPNAPRRPDVSNLTTYAGNQESHRLQVRWRQLESTPLEPISGYYVYRWNSPGDVQKYAVNPLVNRISGLIPQVPGETRLTFVDDGAGAPTAPADHDKTFWYSVRAVKQTAAGGNLSPNSAPAFGVLRNRFAPAAPEGKVFITCCRPDVQPDRVEDVADPAAADPLRAIFDLVCTRDSRTVAWAEFALNDIRDPEQFVGRYHFQFFRKQVRARLDLGRALVAGGSTTVYCRVGDSGSKASGWVQLTERGAPAVGSVRRFLFEAGELCEEVELTDKSIADGCDSHSPGGLKFPAGPLAIPQDGENPANPIKLELTLTERAREYRVYRRVDQGDLSLWRQGLDDEAAANKIVLEDGALPPNAGEVSYFGQFLDDNGNASEFKLIGKHVAVAQPAPRPMLSPPEIAGSDADPRMKIRWFSPPHGVERFAVILAVDPGPVPDSISPDLSTNTESPQAKFNLKANADAEPQNIVFGAYLTPTLDGGFGPGPDYEISIPVQKGRVYQVQIRAIAKANGAYSYSTAYSFQWPTEGHEEATGPNVPWPARPTPPVSPAFAADLAPVRVQHPDFNGLGVVIGHIPQPAMNPTGSLIGEDADIRSYLFSAGDESGNALLPLMLYRYQIPGTAFPTPSRDLIQVTPLMQNIASAPAGGQRLIRDPYIKLIGPDPSSGGPDDPWKIVLLDTQPAVRGAAYTYVLVRFRKDGEIASVHPLPSILVP
jgi:hypothetical protein